MKLTVKTTETITPATREILRRLRSPEPVIAMGRGVADEARNFYAGLEQTRPNKRGFPRQHFWSAVRRSVNNPVQTGQNSAVVAITHPNILQRIRGGYIYPRPGRKYLTLPAAPEAYGKRAREFHNLRFGFAQNKYGNLAPALVEDSAQKVSFGRRRKDGTRKVTPGDEVGGKAFFMLVRRVYQQPDPTALPSDQQLERAASQAADTWAQHMVEKVNKGGTV